MEVIADPIRHRLLWVDYARGIAIVCVVFGHVSGGLAAAGLLAPDGWQATLVSFFFTFRMPVLFFLSGLFLRPLFGNSATFVLVNRATLIGYPYVVWSIIHGATREVFAEHVNGGPSFRVILATFLFRPFGELWFLHALFWISLMLFAFQSVKMSPWVICLTAFAFHEVSLLPLPELAFTYFPILRYSLFVAAGYWLGSRFALWGTRQTAPWLLLGSGLFCSLLALGGAVAFDRNPFFSLPLSSVGGGGILLLSRWLETFDPLPLLRSLGRRSLVIYLVHPLATGGTRIFLRDVLGIKAGGVQIPLGLLCGVLFPLWLYWLGRKLCFEWLFSLKSLLRRSKLKRDEAMSNARSRSLQASSESELVGAVVPRHYNGPIVTSKTP